MEESRWPCGSALDPLESQVAAGHMIFGRINQLWKVSWGRVGRMELPLHDALEDDDLVVVRAGRHGAQGLDVRGHVVQVVGAPDWGGQVGPALPDSKTKWPQHLVVG